MSSRNPLLPSNLGCLQIRLLKFAYSTATHGTRRPWEYADARIDYVLTIQEIPVETRDGVYENQIILAITGGQTQFDHINLVDLSHLARNRHPSSPLPPVTIQVACEKSIRVAVRYLQGQIENQNHGIDRRFQVWIHDERDLLQLLSILQRLGLPITYIDNRAAFLGGEVSLAASESSTNVNSTVDRISLPPRPTSTVIPSIDSNSHAPYHPSIRPTSTGTFKIPPRPQSSSSEIHRPSSTSTLSAFDRAAVAKSGFSSSPAPHVLPHMSQTLRVDAQRPASAFAIMGRHIESSPTGQRNNEYGQTNNPAHQNTSSIYLSQMQKNPATVHGPQRIWDPVAPGTSQFQPQLPNQSNYAFPSTHAHPAAELAFSTKLDGSSKIIEAPTNNTRALSPPSSLPPYRPATAPIIPTIDSSDQDIQKRWVPPRRELPFPKAKEKRKPETDPPVDASPLPKPMVKRHVSTAATVTQTITTPPEKPIERPRKRVAQRRAATKDPPQASPNVPVAPLLVPFPGRPEEPSPLAAKSATTQLKTTAGLQSKAILPVKRSIATTQSAEEPSSLTAKKGAARSNTSSGLQSKAAPPPKRPAAVLSQQKTSAAKRFKTMDQGTQTTMNHGTFQDREDPPRVPSPSGQFLDDLEFAFMKYKSRPTPKEVHETPRYSDMNTEERDEVLQNWFFENLENDDFVAMVGDMSNSWLSIGLDE